MISAGVLHTSAEAPPAPAAPPSNRPAATSRGRHAIALGAAVATLVIMTWDVDRPALWMDESASVLATQRTWADLWVLLRSAEAPIVPYYALLKAATSAVTSLAPGAASAPEVLYRWPSVVVTVLAAWALTWWLARRCSAPLALSTGALLVVTGGLSRYGQEARPYAFALAAAVACTILWTRLVRDRRRRWVVWYALAVVVLTAMHLLGASLVVAHVVAAAVTFTGADRRAAVLRTVSGAAVGLAAALPLAAFAALHARGPSQSMPMTPENVRNVYVHLFTAGERPFLGVGLIVILAVIGATRVVSPSYQSIARLAVAWAIVPPVVLLLPMLVRPNLLTTRYLVFVIPGWAILGGLGVVTTMELARRALHRVRLPVSVSVSVPASAAVPGSRSAGRSILTTGVAGGVATLVVIATAGSQVATLRQYRTLAGHGEDIRPALAAARSPEHAGLPIVFSTAKGAVGIAPYHRDGEDRVVGMRIQRDQRTIWPIADRGPAREDVWRDHQRLVLLLRGRTGACARRARGEDPAAFVARCQPAALRHEGYRVVSATAGGRKWTFAVLARTPVASPR